MIYTLLGTSEISVSAIGVGGLHFGSWVNEEEATAIIHRALDLGVNFIDTAPLYGQGRSEGIIGRAIRGRRHQVVLSTKVGLQPDTVMGGDGPFSVQVAALTKQYVISSLEQSLRHLGTDFVDLYQVHAFDGERLGDTLDALETLIQEGKILAAGCSNYSAEQLRTAWMLGTPFSSFQVEYNLLARRAEDEIVSFCNERGIAILCNRALMRGILSGKYRVGYPPWPKDSRGALSPRLRNQLSPRVMLAAEKLDVLARERGHTGTDLAIAWLLSGPRVASVILGMRNVEQMEANARATEWRLSEIEMAAVDATIDAMGMTPVMRRRPDTFFER